MLEWERDRMVQAKKTPILYVRPAEGTLSGAARVLDDDVRARHRELCSLIVRCHCTPVSLGLRATDTAHKAAALAWCWFLRCNGLPSLLRFIASFVSLTSDMGTESHLTAFSAGSLQNLLPDWLAPSLMPLQGEDGQFDDEVGRLLQTVGTGFLQHAIPVPGAMHILHNLSKDVHGQLPYWDEFWEVLNLVGKLLSNRGRRERFVNECVLRSPGLEQHERDFELNLDTLYDKRWEAVFRFCRRLCPLWPLLQACWDENRFGRAADNDFNPEAACCNECRTAIQP